MKKIIPSLFLATLTSSSLLLAQSEKQATDYRLQATNQVIGCRLQVVGASQAADQTVGRRRTELPLEDQIRQRTETTTNCELPTANCNNQDNDLDCYLMMDPAELKNIEGGIEDLKEVLGSPGKAGLSVSTAAHSPVGNSSSSAAILEARDSDAAATLTVDETGEGDSTKAYLKNEICDNIYMACLAEVATMSLAQRKTAEGMIQEKEEWEAAKDMAMEEEAELKIILERAKGETLAAQKKFDSANAILHGKAYADEAYYNWQVKELAEKLAEARVTTSHATLNAIKFRNTAQRVKSEARLNEAIAMEYKASQALEAATSKTFGEETQSSTSSPSGKQNQVAQYTPRRNSMDAEGVNFSQGAINLPVAPQRPLSPVPSKLPASDLNTIGTEQIFVNSSIPLVEAVAVPSGSNFGEPLNQIKTSEEKVAKEKAVALAEKEKATTAFETEF
ncbi:MAG TPA: hypothetical protein VJK54_06215, partial [Chthoniobacterales bacterium]|nr:hypothetical protein [Chthoniobacterales bacterium]